MPGRGASEKPVKVLDLLPRVGFLEGWILEEGPDIYPPKELFQIVNGAASLYLSYGFRELAYARYIPGKDSTRGISAELYDMGSVRGGFGVYASGRHLNERFQKIGTQGYRSGSYLAAWKKRFYLSLAGDMDDEKTFLAMESLARRIMSIIPGDDEYPTALQWLPDKEKIANSEHYAEKDYLGYDFLNHTVSALYRVDSVTATLFATRRTDRNEAEKIYSRLIESLDNGNENRDIPAASMPPARFTIQNPYQGRILIAKENNFVCGLFSDEKNVTWDSFNKFMNHCTRRLSSFP